MFGVVGAIWISFAVDPYSFSSRFGFASTSLSTFRSRPVCFQVSVKKSGGSFAPAYTYTGDGVVSVTSSTPGTCTVSGGVVSFAAAGTCTLVAQATATANYTAATGSPQSVTIK